MNIDFAEILSATIASLIFTTIGLVFFGISFFIITKLVPFSMRKEIEEDQNVALGIIIGAVIIGISLIISASVG